jgi:energy-converting hydrogenase Eha subunit G
MATQGARLRTGGATRSGGMVMRLTSETKHSLKTTEFWAMVAVIAGILIASWIVGQGDGNGNSNVDAFPAQRAWLYVAIVAVGYMVSRGLAKAGSRDPYWSDGSDIPGVNEDSDAALGRAND